ncbi:MAG TPA: hypothetical protein VGD67_05405 [Pseudonocardiaceae bacterium]
MTDNDRTWEPPLAGTEAEHLAGALDRLHITDRYAREPWQFTSAAGDSPGYGRHTGHADLLRESVDGLVGEDPPRDRLATAARGTR